MRECRNWRIISLAQDQNKFILSATGPTDVTLSVSITDRARYIRCYIKIKYWYVINWFFEAFVSFHKFRITNIICYKYKGDYILESSEVFIKIWCKVVLVIWMDPLQDFRLVTDHVFIDTFKLYLSFNLILIHLNLYIIFHL